MGVNSYVLYSNCQVRLVAEQLSQHPHYFENKLPLPFPLQRRGLGVSVITADKEPREWQVESSRAVCRRSPRREG